MRKLVSIIILITFAVGVPFMGALKGEHAGTRPTPTSDALAARSASSYFNFGKKAKQQALKINIARHILRHIPLKKEAVFTAIRRFAGVAKRIPRTSGRGISQAEADRLSVMVIDTITEFWQRMDPENRFLNQINLLANYAEVDSFFANVRMPGKQGERARSTVFQKIAQAREEGRVFEDIGGIFKYSYQGTLRRFDFFTGFAYDWLEASRTTEATAPVQKWRSVSDLVTEAALKEVAQHPEDEEIHAAAMGEICQASGIQPSNDLYKILDPEDRLLAYFNNTPLEQIEREFMPSDRSGVASYRFVFMEHLNVVRVKRKESFDDFRGLLAVEGSVKYGRVQKGTVSRIAIRLVQFLYEISKPDHEINKTLYQKPNRLKKREHDLLVSVALIVLGDLTGELLIQSLVDMVKQRLIENTYSDDQIVHVIRSEKRIITQRDMVIGYVGGHGHKDPRPYMFRAEGA